MTKKKTAKKQAKSKAKGKSKKVAKAKPAAKVPKAPAKAGGKKPKAAKTLTNAELGGKLTQALDATHQRTAGAKKKMSGLDAAAKVLAEASGPLGTKVMVERALAKGYWKTGGKTPAATIYAAILREMKTKGKDARFKKTGRGKFALAK